MGDAINLDKNVLREMYLSGCIGIKFGVESGSPVVLASLGKPVNLDKVKNIVKWCRYYRIKTHATFSLGLFTDTEETLIETVEFIKHLDVDTIQVSISTPFPGTEFYDKAKNENLIRTEMWEKYDGKVSEVYNHPKLDWEYVEKMRKEILRKWIFWRLSSINWVRKQISLFFRILKGLGIGFVLQQIYSIILDEMLNRNEKNKKCDCVNP